MFLELSSLIFYFFRIAKFSADNAPGFDGLPYSAHNCRNNVSSVLIEFAFRSMCNNDDRLNMHGFSNLMQCYPTCLRHPPPPVPTISMCSTAACQFCCCTAMFVNFRWCWRSSCRVSACGWVAAWGHVLIAKALCCHLFLRNYSCHEILSTRTSMLIRCCLDVLTHLDPAD